MASPLPHVRGEVRLTFDGRHGTLRPLSGEEAREYGFDVLIEGHRMPALVLHEGLEHWAWTDSDDEVVLTRLERAHGEDLDARNCVFCEDRECVVEKWQWPLNPILSSVTIHGCNRSLQ